MEIINSPKPDLILRIYVDSKWNLADWTKLFSDIEIAYSGLLIFEYISKRRKDLQEFEKKLDNIGLGILKTIYQYQINDVFKSYQKSSLIFPDKFWKDYSFLAPKNLLNDETRNFISFWDEFPQQRLIVDKIRYASPGWMELIGSLNPLKVIADIIRDWRKENTERLRINQQFQLDKERLELEKAKLLTQAKYDNDNLKANEKKSENEAGIELRKIDLEQARIVSNENIELNKIQFELFQSILTSSPSFKEVVENEVNNENIEGTKSVLIEKIKNLVKNPMIINIDLEKPTKRNKKSLR